MKKNDKGKKKITNTELHTIITVVTLAIVSSVVMSSVWQIPQAAASSLEEIKASREVSSPIDQVWNVASYRQRDKILVHFQSHKKYQYGLC